MAVVLAGALALFALSSDGADVAVDETIEVEPVAEILSPREYLFTMYPALARRFDCVIRRESGWYAAAQNPRSGAAGLTQMMMETWLSTPQGKRGESRFDAYANLDAAAWLVNYGGGWGHWSQTIGGC